MKKILLIATSLLISGIAFGQGSLKVKKAQLNLGVGLSNYGVPIYIGFDYGVHPDVTIGAELSYRRYTYNENYWKYRFTSTILGISGNVNYHFNRILELPKEFDFYGGLNLGYVSWTTNYDDNYKRNNNGYNYNGGRSGIGLGAQLGARYYFSNNFGINLELGGGNFYSGGKIGITVKL